MPFQAMASRSVSMPIEIWDAADRYARLSQETDDPMTIDQVLQRGVQVLVSQFMRAYEDADRNSRNA